MISGGKVTSDGNITVPAKFLVKLGVKAGDRLRLRPTDTGELIITAVRRRPSIFDSLDKLRLPSIGRPVTRADIDAAITEEVNARHRRVARDKTASRSAKS